VRAVARTHDGEATLLGRRAEARKGRTRVIVVDTVHIATRVQVLVGLCDTAARLGALGKRQVLIDRRGEVEINTADPTRTANVLVSLVLTRAGYFLARNRCGGRSLRAALWNLPHIEEALLGVTLVTELFRGREAHAGGCGERHSDSGCSGGSGGSDCYGGGGYLKKGRASIQFFFGWNAELSHPCRWLRGP
jgi:hypothetical protein